MLPRLPHTLVPLAAAAALLPLLGGCEATPRPNIVLIVIDTLRADHLSLYGYERTTSPWLARLAARGWVFERHLTHASQTVPATLSLLLSQVPAEHGLVHRFHGQFSEAPPRYPDRLLFLAEVLQREGYATAAFAANPFLSARNGFDQGFDSFVHGVVSDGRIARSAIAWLGAREPQPGRPFFLYVHLMQPHAPYTPPERYAAAYPEVQRGEVLRHTGELPEIAPEDLAATIAAYDACIGFADELVGEIVVELYRLGVADDTIVAITSDHGEEFHEHRGLGHGTTVYGELLRVPLILIYPRRLEAGRRVAHRTQHLDLAPTLLELAGIEKPDSFRGTSLFEPADVVFAEEGPWRAVHGDGFKLVRQLAEDLSEVYADGDVLDQRPLPDGAPAAELARELEGYLALDAATVRPGDEGEAPGWSSEEREQLRRLGYAE